MLQRRWTSTTGQQAQAAVEWRMVHAACCYEAQRRNHVSANGRAWVGHVEGRCLQPDAAAQRAGCSVSVCAGCVRTEACDFMQAACVADSVGPVGARAGRGGAGGRKLGRLSSLLVAHVFASNSWLLGSEKMRAYHADRSARRAARLTHSGNRNR